MELENRGLETKGLKSDLTKRLSGFLATEDRVMHQDGTDRLQPTPHVHGCPAAKEESPSLLFALVCALAAQRIHNHSAGVCNRTIAPSAD